MSITNIYEIIDAIITMIMLWIVYVHVYGIEVSVFRKGTLRETMKKPTLFYKLSQIKPSLWITGLCELLTCVTWTEKTEDVQMLLCLFFGQAFFFCATKEKKFRNSFWIWPVMFTTYLPISILDIIIHGFGGNGDWISIIAGTITGLILDALLLPLYIYIYFLDKKYKFSKRVHKNEKLLVVLISNTISLFGATLSSSEAEDGFRLGAGSTFLYLAFAIFALIMVIRIIYIGTSADYYEELSAVHEKNARETLAFYESYKDAQIETRKLRHDMKNHFACIQMLAKEEKYAELQEYLESFNGAVSEVSMEIQTGNDIVDAILNVKLKSAKKEDITFAVTGMIPYMPYIDAMDWCKMVSNAVDNGLEALRECSVSEKVLRIQFKSNGNFFVIHTENACEQEVQMDSNGIPTQKQDKTRHGFGLKNIEAAVKKYKGEMQISCSKNKEHYIFALDLLLPIKKE